MIFDINKFRKYCINLKYYEYITLLKKLEEHIYNLYSKYLIINNEKNININTLYDIQQKIINKYKILINENINIEDYQLPEIILNNINKFKLNYKSIYNIIYEYININYILNNDVKINNYKQLLDEFNEIKRDIEKLTENIGIPSGELINIINLLNDDIFIRYMNEDIINKKQKKFIDKLKFYNNVFASYSYIIINNNIITNQDKELIKMNNEFYTNEIYIKKMIDKYKKEELIYNNYQLYIKIKKNKWMIINGYFKQDQLLFYTKCNNLEDNIGEAITNKLLLLEKKVNNYETL